MNTKRVVKQYLRAIRKELPLPYITSKVIIKEIRQAIYESKANYDWTFEELNSNFGTPAEVAKSFQSADMSKELHKKVVKMRTIFIGVSIFVVLLITFVIILATTGDDTTHITNYGTLSSN